MDNSTINTVNTEPNSTAEDSAGKGDKLFTQDEVNRIVSERLARERAKSEPSSTDAREQALKARESRLECREYLDTVDISDQFKGVLLDTLDTSDIERFKEHVEKYADAGLRVTTFIKGADVANPPTNCPGGCNIDEELRKAFRP